MPQRVENEGVWDKGSPFDEILQCHCLVAPFPLFRILQNVLLSVLQAPNVFRFGKEMRNGKLASCVTVRVDVSCLRGERDSEIVEFYLCHFDNLLVGLLRLRLGKKKSHRSAGFLPFVFDSVVTQEGEDAGLEVVIADVVSKVKYKFGRWTACDKLH